LKQTLVSVTFARISGILNDALEDFLVEYFLPLVWFNLDNSVLVELILQIAVLRLEKYRCI
jgi:hypothetical protein